MYDVSVMWDIGWGGDKDVIHVDYDFSCSSEVSENCIHHGLERARRIC